MRTETRDSSIRSQRRHIRIDARAARNAHLGNSESDEMAAVSDYSRIDDSASWQAEQRPSTSTE